MRIIANSKSSDSLPILSVGTYSGLIVIIVLALAIDMPVLGSGDGPVRLMVLEIVVWIVFGIVVVNDLAFRRYELFWDTYVWLPELLVYLAWCALAVLLAFGVEGQADTIGKLKNLIPGALLFMVVLRAGTSMLRLRIAIDLFIAGVVVNALVGILQFHTGQFYVVPTIADNVWKADLAGHFLENTANGLTNTPNNLAMLIVPGIVCSVVLATVASRRISWSRRCLLMAALALSVLGLYFTFSKGGILWGIVGVAVALFPIARWRLVFAVALLVGMMAIIFWIAVGLGASDQISVDTVASRLLLWQAALRVIDESSYAALFGNAMPMVRYWNSTVAYWSLASTHNTWLDQVIFFGLPAAVLYAVLWGVALRRIAHGELLLTDTAEGRALVRSSFGSLIAICGMSVFEPRADGVYQNAQIFFLMAIGLAAVRNAGRMGQATERPPGQAAITNSSKIVSRSVESSHFG